VITDASPTRKSPHTAVAARRLSPDRGPASSKNTAYLPGLQRLTL